MASSQIKDWTRLSCIDRWFFTTETPGKPLIYFFDVKLFVDLFIQQMCTRHYFEPVVRLWIQAWNNIKSISSNAYFWVREANSRLKDKVIHNIISDIINVNIWEAAYQELTYPKSSSTPHNNSWGSFIVPILFWEDRFRIEGTLAHVVLGRAETKSAWSHDQQTIG